MRLGIVVCLLILVPFATSATGSSRPAGFVVRSGASLRLDGKPFRFGGANIEWLGVAGYGPADPAGPHYPSHYEVDDALATARELGVTVVRSQTMGDSVGCDVVHRAGARRSSTRPRSSTSTTRSHLRARTGSRSSRRSSATTRARAARLRLPPLARHLRPDCSLINMAPFWTDPTVIGDVEAHIAALLDHVNVYTHVAYKDDPTILGWDLMNGGGSPTPWTRRSSTSSAASTRPSHPLRLRERRHRGVDACVSLRLPALVACRSRS